MYGGLDTIKSYLLPKKLSMLEFINLILFSICCIFALNLATFMLFFDMSKQVPRHNFLSFNIDIIIQPLPLPMSKIFLDE